LCHENPTKSKTVSLGFFLEVWSSKKIGGPTTPFKTVSRLALTVQKKEGGGNKQQEGTWRPIGGEGKVYT